MEGLFRWVRNILFFLVMINLAQTVLPTKKYESFFRFFAGIVLIILTLGPALDLLGMDEEIVRQIEGFSLETKAEDLSGEILEIERIRRERIFDEYEEEAAARVETMVREAGFVPVKTEVRIEDNENRQNYASVTHIAAVVRREDGETASAGASSAAGGEIRIEPVTVRLEPAAEAGAAGEDPLRPEESPQEDPLREDPLIGELRRKVGQYYGLESENVEIQLEER